MSHASLRLPTLSAADAGGILIRYAGRAVRRSITRSMVPAGEEAFSMMGRRSVAAGVCALVIAAVAAAPRAASAQANSGRIAFNTGIDGSHAYFFRGIRQERYGVILQPYFDLTATLLDGGGMSGSRSLELTFGQWNSVHSSGPVTLSGPGSWYESDLFAGFVLGLANWDVGLSYTSYMSPNHSFGTVQELGINLSLDDVGVTRLPLPLQPHVAVAIELSGQADGGASEGSYLELGVAPGMDLAGGAASVAVPVTLGMSLSNYYEDGAFYDDSFGFLDLGVVFGVPLRVPEAYGSWELSAGAHMLLLGGYLESLNSGEQFQTIASFGLSIGY